MKEFFLELMKFQQEDKEEVEGYLQENTLQELLEGLPVLTISREAYDKINQMAEFMTVVEGL